MNNATALEYWTLMIAVVGGLTGVAALVTQVWGLALAGPRVKVTVANALITGNGSWVLSLDASNVGRLPVTLLEMGVTFRAGGRRRLSERCHPGRGTAPQLPIGFPTGRL